MILRKPYAILIKYFRLIHLVLGLLMGYMFYRTSLIMTFINDYLSSVQTLVKSDTVNSLFGNVFILVILAIAIISSIIMALMTFKNKPIKFYIYNILSYIFSGVIYILAYNIIRKLEIGLVDIRTLKLVQDLITAIVLFQSLALIFVVIRATGFDIKSFNFKEDLEILNIEVKDNEEFEVDLDIDTDILKRKINKRFRYARYIYIENKLFINIMVLLIIMVSLAFSYFNVNIYNKTLEKHEVFKTIEYIIETDESYVTNTDMYDIDIKSNLVIVKFKIKKMFSLTKKLNTGRFALDISNNSYYHTNEFDDKIKDIGISYKSQTVNDYFDNYLLVFKVPNNIDSKKMTIRYFDINNETVKINILPNYLNKPKKTDSKKTNEVITFKDSVLENTSLKINSYQLENSFKIDYKYCIEKECFDSYEYLKPSINSNDTKALLKLDVLFDTDKSISSNYMTFPLFVKYFMSIKYEKNNQVMSVKTDFKNVEPVKTTKQNEYYIEVPAYIKDADKIELIFNIRNSIYSYKLK